MAKDKRTLHIILFIVAFVLLVIFLIGQSLIVALYGPHGSVVDLGLNGYPDYIGLVSMADSKKPSLPLNDLAIESNQDSILRDLKESSHLVYIWNNDYFTNFIVGNINFKPGDSIYNHVSISGGELAALLEWGMTNKGLIKDKTQVDVFNYEHKYDIERVSIKSDMGDMVITYTVSMKKLDMLSYLDNISVSAYKYLLGYFKDDTIYFTIEYKADIVDGAIDSVSGIRVAVNDTTYLLSSGISQYFESKSGGMFKTMSEDMAYAINRLGHISTSGNQLIVSNN